MKKQQKINERIIHVYFKQEEEDALHRYVLDEASRVKRETGINVTASQVIKAILSKAMKKQN